MKFNFGKLVALCAGAYFCIIQSDMDRRKPEHGYWDRRAATTWENTSDIVSELNNFEPITKEQFSLESTIELNQRCAVSGQLVSNLNSTNPEKSTITGKITGTVYRDSLNATINATSRQNEISNQTPAKFVIQDKTGQQYIVQTKVITEEVIDVKKYMDNISEDMDIFSPNGYRGSVSKMFYQLNMTQGQEFITLNLIGENQCYGEEEIETYVQEIKQMFPKAKVVVHREDSRYFNNRIIMMMDRKLMKYVDDKIDLRLQNMIPLHIYLQQDINNDDIDVFGTITDFTSTGIPVITMEAYEVDGKFIPVYKIPYGSANDLADMLNIN